MTAAERPYIEAIRKRASAATPGPWFWYGNLHSHQIQLATQNDRWPGWSVVMDAARWGMDSATFRFIDKTGLMHKATDDPMPIYQVCPDCTDRNDERVYRRHVVGLRHPDAQFIASARQDIEDLLAYIGQLERSNG